MRFEERNSERYYNGWRTYSAFDKGWLSIFLQCATKAVRDWFHYVWVNIVALKTCFTSRYANI